MTAPDPFTTFADRAISAPVKRKLARREKAEERKILNSTWERWRRQRTAALLKGPHGEAAGALVQFLHRMTLQDAGALIELVEAGPWRSASADVRFEVIALVDAGIIALRERSGLAAFDDPLDDEAPDAFLLVREMLR